MLLAAVVLAAEEEQPLPGVHSDPVPAGQNEIEKSVVGIGRKKKKEKR